MRKILVEFTANPLETRGIPDLRCFENLEKLELKGASVTVDNLLRCCSANRKLQIVLLRPSYLKYKREFYMNFLPSNITIAIGEDERFELRCRSSSDKFRWLSLRSCNVADEDKIIEDQDPPEA